MRNKCLTLSFLLCLLSPMVWADQTSFSHVNGEPPHHYVKVVGNFDYAGKPLLEAALREDPNYCSHFHKKVDEVDYTIALENYKQYLAEGNPEPYERANILARIGLMHQNYREVLDKELANQYLREAINVTDDTILSYLLFRARLNYVATLKEADAHFEAWLDLYDWLSALDETSATEAVMRLRGELDTKPQMIHIDVQTGERKSIQPFNTPPEGSPDVEISGASQQTQREANRIIMLKETFMESEQQMPALCVDAALRCSYPLEAMNRLIEHTEGTLIAEYAMQQMEQAEVAQRMWDDLEQMELESDTP